MKLIIADYFFLTFHTSLIFFNLFGWSLKKTRKWNLLTLSLTLGSWVVLGIFWGWGYCPLTDWHWDILVQLGERDLPHSYITYLLLRILGWAPSASIVENGTWIALLISLCASIYLNVKDKRYKN